MNSARGLRLRHGAEDAPIHLRECLPRARLRCDTASLGVRVSYVLKQAFRYVFPELGSGVTLPL